MSGMKPALIAVPEKTNRNKVQSGLEVALMAVQEVFDEMAWSFGRSVDR